MRGMILWVASVVCFSVVGAERPRFADLRAGDAVVAVYRMSGCFSYQHVRFQLQKTSAGMVVSVWNLFGHEFETGLMGHVTLTDEQVLRLDRTLIRSRVPRGPNHTTNEHALALFWQCSGVRYEEKWHDTDIDGDAGGLSLLTIFSHVELQRTERGE